MTPYEVGIDEFSKMIFNVMVGSDQYDIPDHWKKIRKEALPLIYQLIELGEKAGYEISGYIDKNGNKILSNYEKRLIARAKKLKCKASNLKVGDYVWQDEQELGCDPYLVIDITERNIYIECGSIILILPPDKDILLAPKNWREVKFNCE